MAAPEDLESRFLSADPRTLILKVLVAAGRTGGVSADDVVEFLECSFGVFQMQAAAGGQGGWDRHALEASLANLLQHSLIERGEDARLHLTNLGRLAGESAVEVETLIRAIHCLRQVRSDQITDPALITLAQTSVELDAINFPVNKISKRREPQHWFNRLQQQGISPAILGALQRNIGEDVQPTVRAKKAAVCLYYVSGMGMAEIENAVSQFGGGFGGSSGPIFSVTERTCDVLPMIARAAELLQPGLELQERTARLLVRVELGIQGPAVDLARHAGRALDRTDYRRLCEAGLTELDALTAADDAALLRLLANDLRKVTALRAAVEKWRAVRPGRPPAPLPPYEQ